MGAGIATSFLSAGYDVAISDVSDEMLERTRQYVRKVIDSAVRKKYMTESKAAKVLASLRVGTDLTIHADRDLCVECVFESMKLKRQIFEELSRITPTGTILCTNTSTLDIDAIAGMCVIVPLNVRVCCSLTGGNFHGACGQRQATNPRK